MTRYALVQSGLMPIAHAAEVADAHHGVGGGTYHNVTRLCRPLNPLAWVPETVPYATERQITEAMAGPDACPTCARTWHRTHNPAPAPATVHDADDLGTTSLLDLL